MLLTPLLNILRPSVSSWIKQSRNLRPSIKIGKENFQITIDVQQFRKDEIRIKARPEYVIIEGKLERNIKGGHITRQFVRKFKLPEGCSPETMQSTLSPNGLLTITARRKVCDINVPCETVVPITFCGPDKESEQSIIPVVENDENPCSKYMPKNKKDKTNQSDKSKK